MVSHKGEVKIHSSTLVSRLLVELFFIDNTLNKPSLKDFKFSMNSHSSFGRFNIQTLFFTESNNFGYFIDNSIINVCTVINEHYIFTMSRAKLPIMDITANGIDWNLTEQPEIQQIHPSSLLAHLGLRSLEQPIVTGKQIGRAHV